MAENLDIYESCRQLRKTNRPDVLDDLLEIEFIHVPTKKLLKRARFFVTADEPTSQRTNRLHSGSASIPLSVEVAGR